MHETIYRYYEQMLEHYPITGNILEIGASPTKDCLLLSPVLASARLRVGINLDRGDSLTRISDRLSPEALEGIVIMPGNANDMSFFKNNAFQAVLSNAVAEHDKYFWKSLSEMRRVLAPGGLMIVSVPGYVREVTARESPMAALTHRVHNWPGDYYRFSEQCCREVFFEEMDVIDQHVIIAAHTPKIITTGRKRP